MDITVRNLNHRLALQLPTDLPLGLVFVMGIVREIRRAPEGKTAVFSLVDDQHHLRCLADAKTLAGIPFEEGIQIRAGGHLQFDVQTADYFLLARDVELVGSDDSLLAEEATGAALPQPTALPRSSITPILADIEQRAAENELVRAELPNWVERMAPEDVKQELAAQEAEAKRETAVSSPQDDPAETVSSTDTKQAAALEALTEAMESESDVELTPEMVSELDVPPYVPPPSTTDQEAEPEAEHAEQEDAAAETADSIPLSTTYRPPQEAQTDWLVIGLVGVLLLFVLIIVYILLFVVF